MLADLKPYPAYKDSGVPWLGKVPKHWEVLTFFTPEVKRLLKALRGEMSRSELQKKLGLKNAEHFRKHYMAPALDGGYVEMTLPDKPNSRLQRYRLTKLGRHVLAQQSGENA